MSDPTQDPVLWKRLQDLARAAGAWFIFGAKSEVDAQNDARFRNTAFVMAPNGTVAGKHIKNHPVHFIKDGIAGTEARAISTSLGRLGVGICFDMDYPDVARRLAGDGAEAFLVPNMDPQEWGNVQQAQHRLLFQMRAAENGRWLARADVAGGTSIVTPTGREVARVRTSEAAVLDGVIGRGTGKTLYVLGGWRFGQVCLVTLLVLCAVAVFRRFRPITSGR